ncbi:MAG: putative Bug family protein, precursor [Deltaproteobacteria bacterium]|jgi:tripartite-type tricarboxylate transporter receptor subunit TctC|nr:putative Bug family protein, precursor [Deltaproteobacteria bacterium]
MKGRLFFVFFMALTLGFGAVPAPADEFPSRPLTLQVAMPAGGSTDVGARILASIAEKMMGQPIVVVNKVGAGGQIGWTELARQKPDGYYLGFLMLPSLNTCILDPDRKATFNLDSFVPIINQVSDPGLIWVKADSPYKTLKDLLDDARKSPGVIRASTTGILTDDHLAIYMMEQAAGVQFRVVHLQGAAPQLTATLGGQVDVSFDNVGSVAPRVKAGELRGLAVMDSERSKFLPDVPTTAELGYPTVISSSTRGVAGPAGIPEPIVKKLQTVLKKAMEDPEHIKKMDQAGLAIKPMLGEEYGKFLRQINEKAKPLVESSRKSK